MPVFKQTSIMPVGREPLFDYHRRPGAFDRLTPPWERIGVFRQTGTIADGGELSFRIQRGPFHLTWTARHEAFLEGRQFGDRQVSGPFRHWFHLHRFLDNGTDESLLEDTIDWELPHHGLLYPLAGNAAHRSLLRLFHYRHQRTYHDLKRFAAIQRSGVKSVVLAGRHTPFTHRLACFLSLGGLNIFRVAHKPDTHGAGPWFRTYFGGDKAHPLGPKTAVIFSERLPRLRSQAEEKDIAEIDFLCRALATESSGTSLLVRLHLPRASLDHYITQPALEFGGFRGRTTMQNEVSRAQDRLSESFDREAHFHFGCLVQAPIGSLVQLLLRMETFLFLKKGAVTPRFPWISQDDALGAIYHLLHRPGLAGRFALAAPSLASRAELQEALIKKYFFAYSLQRILKVLPWSAPGGPAGLDRDLAELKQLAATGFAFLTPELPIAVDHELGNLVRPEGFPPN